MIEVRVARVVNWLKVTGALLLVACARMAGAAGWWGLEGAAGTAVHAATRGTVGSLAFVVPGFGWSVIDARSGTHAYVGNWFSGEVIKLDLQTGDVVARVIVAEKCMAGIAQYLPAP